MEIKTLTDYDSRCSDLESKLNEYDRIEWEVSRGKYLLAVIQSEMEAVGAPGPVPEIPPYFQIIGSVEINGERFKTRKRISNRITSMDIETAVKVILDSVGRSIIKAMRGRLAGVSTFWP